MKKYILLILMFITSIGYSQKSVVINASSSEPSVDISNYYYVSKTTGNNNTAIAGDPTKAWSDPWAASEAASEDALIYVTDGRWTYSWDQTPALMVFDSSEMSLVDNKSLNFYFAPKTALINVSVGQIPSDLFTLFDVKEGKKVNIYGEGSFIGDDNGIIGTTSNNSTLNVNLDTLLVSPWEGGEDASWIFGGFNVKNDTSAIFKLTGKTLITNFDVAASITGNCDSSSFYVFFENQNELKSDGSIHFRSAIIKNTQIYTEVNNYYGVDPEWYVWSPYRVLFENCNVTARYNNVFTKGTPYTWNAFFSIRNGDHINSNFDFSLKGKGSNRLLAFEVGNGSNSSAINTSNSTYNFNFDFVCDSVGVGNPLIRLFNPDSSTINMQLNLLNYDTNVSVFSNMTGDWFGAKVTIEGNVKTYGKTIFDIGSELTGSKFLLKNFYGESDSLLILSTTPVTLNNCSSNIKTSNVDGNVIIMDDCSQVSSPTTLQEAIDAQEAADGGGYMYVEFPNGGYIEDDETTFNIRTTDIEQFFSFGKDAIGQLFFGANPTLESDVNTGFLLNGFGEDVNGEGGDYSTLRPDAIVPKAYVDNLPPTTLQQAIDAQDDGGEIIVSFYEQLEINIEEGGGTAFNVTDIPFEIVSSTGRLSVGGDNNQLISLSGDWLLNGYGEDPITGIGGNYSSLRPDAIVPKAYVDSKIFVFEGVTDYEDSHPLGNGNNVKGFLQDNGTIETFAGVSLNPAEPYILFSFFDYNGADGSSALRVKNENFLLFNNYHHMFGDDSKFYFEDKTVAKTGLTLLGFGENPSTGIGGNYSSLQSNSLVPKAYVDSKIFEGVTQYQFEYGDSETLKGFRNYSSGDQIEAFSGVNNREELVFAQLSSADIINEEFSSVQVEPNIIFLSSNNIDVVPPDDGIFNGIVYNADYSANYTDRSLVDKGYVDNVAISLYTGSGSVTDGTEATIGTNSLFFGNKSLGGTDIVDGIGSFIDNNNYNFYGINDGADGEYVNVFKSTLGSDVGSFIVSHNGLVTSFFDGTNSSFLSLGQAGLFIRTDSEAGAKYFADYSANYTDRSLVDKAYVDLHDTIIVNIPCFKFNETVTTGECGFFAVPNNLIGDDIIDVQFAYATAGTGSTSDLQISDGFTGFFGATMADGDRVETVNNGGTPITMTSEQVIYVNVVSTSTTPAEGLSVNLTILKKR